MRGSTDIRGGVVRGGIQAEMRGMGRDRRVRGEIGMIGIDTTATGRQEENGMRVLGEAMDIEGTMTAQGTEMVVERMTAMQMATSMAIETIAMIDGYPRHETTPMDTILAM